MSTAPSITEIQLSTKRPFSKPFVTISGYQAKYQNLQIALRLLQGIAPESLAHLLEAITTDSTVLKQ